MKIKVIADEFTCLGFKLAGVETAVAEEKDDVERVFRESLEDEEAGLILITEKQADMIRKKVNQHKTEGEIPLVVEIPSREGWEEKGKALKLINRVLSIEV